jgi:hypothetical protein
MAAARQVLVALSNVEHRAPRIGVEYLYGDPPRLLGTFVQVPGIVKELLSHIPSDGFTHQPNEILLAASRVFMNV